MAFGGLFTTTGMFGSLCVNKYILYTYPDRLLYTYMYSVDIFHSKMPYIMLWKAPNFSVSDTFYLENVSHESFRLHSYFTGVTAMTHFKYERIIQEVCSILKILKNWENNGTGGLCDPASGLRNGFVLVSLSNGQKEELYFRFNQTQCTLDVSQSFHMNWLNICGDVELDAGTKWLTFKKW